MQCVVWDEDLRKKTLVHYNIYSMILELNHLLHISRWNTSVTKSGRFCAMLKSNKDGIIKIYPSAGAHVTAEFVLNELKKHSECRSAAERRQYESENDQIIDKSGWKKNYISFPIFRIVAFSKRRQHESNNVHLID